MNRNIVVLLMLAGCSSADSSGAPSTPTCDACSAQDAPSYADRPTPTVGKCDKLPAAGAWENITPAGQNSFGAVALDPFDVGTVWGVGDSNKSAPGGIWKSTDCGATFTHVNTGMNGKEIDGSRAWSIAVDYIDKGTLYLPIYYGASGLWKSTDGGQDWSQLMLPDGVITAAAPIGNAAAIGSVAMDPNDHLHLMVGTHLGCKPPNYPLCAGETRDGGKTWSVINVKIPGVTDWLEQAGPYPLDANTIVYATLFNGIWYSDDHGTTWHDATPKEVIGATGAEWAHRPLSKTATGKYYLAGYGNNNGLLESADGKSWSYVPNSPHYGYEAGFTVAGGKLFMCDNNGSDCSSSTEAASGSWTDLPKVKGSAALEYDDVHHILYSANFDNGLWRTIVN